MAAEYAVVAIDKLSLDPSNARKHGDQNLSAIKGSLSKFGQQKPIVVTRKNVVIAGNGTLAAAKDLGWKEIQVRYTDLSGPEAIAFALADNRTSELAEWDKDILGAQLQALYEDGFGIAEIGFDPGDWIKDIIPNNPFDSANEDAVPDDAPSRVKIGEIWQLGDHRLMCGDSTKTSDVSNLMNSQQADVVFTDPPYNLQERGQTKRTNKSESKRQDFGEWDVGFDPMKVLPLLLEYSKKDAHIFICTSNYLFGLIHGYLEKTETKPNYIVWCKNNPMPSLTKNRFVQATELVVHGIKGKPVFKYPSGENAKNWFNTNVEPHTTGHPAQKPIGMVEHFLKLTDGDVLDLFLGSGSTLIACEKTGRKCFGMELDPHYCDIILARWESLTGKSATLVTNG